MAGAGSSDSGEKSSWRFGRVALRHPNQRPNRQPGHTTKARIPRLTRINHKNLLRRRNSRHIQCFSCSPTLQYVHTAASGSLRKSLDLTQSSTARDEVCDLSGLKLRSRFPEPRTFIRPPPVLLRRADTKSTSPSPSVPAESSYTAAAPPSSTSHPWAGQPA